MIRILPAALVASALSLLSVSAQAQFLGNNGAVSIRPKSGEETAGRAKPVPPPALPGSRLAPGAAPAARSPSDMSPNEALFDAINRGDISAVRDALNRGAELGSRNILGMTPLELSVDLGRNDISFLLLSMRGDTPRQAPPTPDAASLFASGPKPSGARPERRAVPVKVAATDANADRAPKLFANDGGSPVPSVGFLGFDATR